jgi:hypothetical protein
MDNTDYRTGWSTKVWIETKESTTYAFYDRFNDEKSGKPLEDESLFVSRRNFKHRGNETDELICYNRNTTPDKYMKVWHEWDLEKIQKKEEIKQIAKTYGLKVSFD